MNKTQGWIYASLICLCGSPAYSSADREPIFHTGSYNPFTQIFGRPDFFGGSTLSAGQWEARTVFTITSHTEPAGSGVEALELDGESYRLGLTIARGIGNRLEIGGTAALLHTSGGFLDGIVEDWHDVVGASNAQRDARARNQLNFRYDRAGERPFALEDTNTGIGDLQLYARYQLLDTATTRRRLALHSGVKLPTGSASHLRGSGAADYSVGLGFSDPVTLAAANMTFSAHAGMLFLGDGDALKEFQENQVPFGGVQIGMRFGKRFDLMAQVQAAGSYYDSRLSTLGDTTVQLSLGANVRFPSSGWNLSFGIVEDAFSDMMPDFALYSALTRVF